MKYKISFLVNEDKDSKTTTHTCFIFYDQFSQDIF